LRRRVNILTVVVLFLHDKQDCLSRYQGKQLCHCLFYFLSICDWLNSNDKHKPGKWYIAAGQHWVSKTKPRNQFSLFFYCKNLTLYHTQIQKSFDVRGDVKIFDLGLAKELGCSKDNGDGTYQLTGDTGSPRYVAFGLRKVGCTC